MRGFDSKLTLWTRAPLEKRAKLHTTGVIPIAASIRVRVIVSRHALPP